MPNQRPGRDMTPVAARAGSRATAPAVDAPSATSGPSTLTEVAREVGVSVSTVSRVMRGAPGVAVQTRESVLAAADRLGFRFNSAARALRTKAPSSMLGVVVPDIADPYFAALCRGIQDAAYEAGYVVVVGAHLNDTTRQNRTVAGLQDLPLAALLLVPTADPVSEELLREQRSGTKIVVMDRPCVGLDADLVTTANDRGARMLTEALIESGHRRIGVVALTPDIWTQQVRLRGVSEALAGHGLELDPALICHSTPARTTEAARDLLTAPQPPTAVIGLSVQPLLGALHAAFDLGMALDYACFDDDPTFSLIDAPIRVIRQDPTASGQQAVELALARINGDTSPPRQVELPLARIDYLAAVDRAHHRI